MSGGALTIDGQDRNNWRYVAYFATFVRFDAPQVEGNAEMDQNRTEAAIAKIAQLVEDLAGEQRKTRALVESRIDLILEGVRRDGETLTRLKLMAENARGVAQAQLDRLSAIERRLGEVASGFGGANQAPPKS